MAGRRGKRFRAGVRQGRPRPPPLAGRSRRPGQGDGWHQVRRDGRSPPAPRGERPPCRGAAPRHAGPAARARQGGCRRGVRRRDAAKAATEAGADHVGAQDLADRVNDGWTDFDVAITTPDLMGPVVSKLGRILGPRARCRTPRSGRSPTTSPRPSREAKAGKVEYRTDRQAIVHLTIGKAELRRARSARELRRRDRRDRSRPSGRRQGSLPAVGHPGDDDGPRHPCRRVPNTRGRDPRERRERSDVVRGGRALAGGGACVESRHTNLPQTVGGARQRRARKTGAGEVLSRCSEPACARALSSRSTGTDPDHMDKEQKSALVDEIADRLGEASAIFAVDYRGISVPQAAELRAKLSEADATFRVVKNRLAKRAVERVGTGELDQLLEGPTALTFVKGDAVTAAKAISTFGRQHDILEYKGGIMDGAPLKPDEFLGSPAFPASTFCAGSSSASRRARSPGSCAASRRWSPASRSRWARSTSRAWSGARSRRRPAPRSPLPTRSPPRSPSRGARRDRGGARRRNGGGARCRGRGCAGKSAEADDEDAEQDVQPAATSEAEPAEDGAAGEAPGGDVQEETKSEE